MTTFPRLVHNQRKYKLRKRERNEEMATQNYRDFTGQADQPATPPTGQYRLYVDDAGDSWIVDDTGTAAAVGGGTAAAVLTVAAAPPVSPAAGDFWLRTLSAASTGQLYAWEADGEYWRAVGAGVGAEATSGVFADQDNRQMGVLLGDPDDGKFAGLVVEPGSNNATLYYLVGDGTTEAWARVSTAEVQLRWSSQTKDLGLTLNDTGINMTGLPTSDPAVAGYLWVDGVTVKRSAG